MQREERKKLLKQALSDLIKFQSETPELKDDKPFDFISQFFQSGLFDLDHRGHETPRISKALDILYLDYAEEMMLERVSSLQELFSHVDGHWGRIQGPKPEDIEDRLTEDLLDTYQLVIEK